MKHGLIIASNVTGEVVFETGKAGGQEYYKGYPEAERRHAKALKRHKPKPKRKLP